MKTDYDSVSQLMSTPIVSIEPQTRVGDVLALAERLEVHHFPLVDDNGLFGVVCTCDLQGARPEQAVSYFAHRDVVTVSPDSTGSEAAAKMKRHGVGSVVVVDDDGVSGILTRNDLAETVPDLMRSERCARCSAREHLRRSMDSELFCPVCEARAVAEANALSSE